MGNKHSSNGTILGTKGQYVYPHSVCYDEWNHHLIVTDSGNDRIQLFDSKTLKYLSKFGSKGYQHGQFNDPYGLCIQPFTRHLLVCDTGNNRLQILDPADHYSFLYQIGSVASNIKGQFNHPGGMCCDEKGHIVVADTWNYRIQEFNEYGQFLHSFELFSNSICYDKEHHQLLVTNGHKVSLWSHDSSSKPLCISHIQLKDPCYSVCVDPLRNHQILIGTYCNVLVYDSRNHKEPIQTLGTVTSGSKLGEFHCVSGLCINEEDGTILVVDKWNHRIQLYK